MRKKLLIKNSILYSTLFIIAIMAYVLIINFMPTYKFLFFQKGIAKIVSIVQSIAGINVNMEGTVLIYPKAFSIEIDLLCTGIYEILFFTALVFAFIGVKLKTKIKGLIIFIPIILIENIVRISMVYPLVVLFDEKTAWMLHNIVYKYLQAIFVLVLIVIWFFAYAKKDFISPGRRRRFFKSGDVRPVL